MALSLGTRFGAFEITGELGAGGMGEVYRATDTSLKREVAIKVLPDAVAADADRLARFQREAEVLAALNHPNIAQIYGLEKADGQTAIVLELVEGPTLADRIAAGPIPPDEALGIARQVADALAAAHGRQIVHRDLKPANVKLRDDGTVKVLDFGISKPVDARAISGGSPVMTTPAVTETGVILGTAAYMSPEQARGRPVDQRTDIWAFGCLLFEMLTGQPAFGGEDVMLTLARVLDRDTDMSSMPKTLSPAVRRAIRLCLQKDPDKRIADIRDVRLALDGAFDVGGTVASAEPTPAGTRARRLVLPIAATAIVTALLVGFGAWRLRPPAETVAVSRFSYAVPSNQPLVSVGARVLDISRDGRAFTYGAATGLYLRKMDELEAHLVPGTAAGGPGEVIDPILSPDGSWVAFGDANTRQLVRIPVGGGAPISVADLTGVGSAGWSWADNDSILFVKQRAIYRVAVSGGAPELLIPAREEGGLPPYGPQLLPSGDAILFSVASSGNWDGAQIVVESLATGERTELLRGGSDARLMPTGQLVYAVGNDLLAVPFDADHLRVAGNPVTVLQGVSRPRNQTGAATNYAVADDGTLVYVPATNESAGFSLVWVGRDGKETPFGLTQSRNYGWMRISPDGNRIAATINTAGKADLWVSAVTRPVLSPITSGGAAPFSPLWSRDGNSVLYSVTGSGHATVFRAPADGAGETQQLLTMETGFLSLEAMADNGRQVVFTYGSVSSPHIGVFDLDADPKAEQWRPLIDRSTGASMLSVSPNGDWIAYQSSDSGQYGVYIERFPELGSRRVISDERGGWGPVWSHDGSELYYRRLGDGAMMAVGIQTSPALRIATPEMLFDSQGYLPVLTPQAGAAAGRSWDIAPDGRFLMIKANAVAGSNEIVVVEHWLDELNRLVPEK